MRTTERLTVTVSTPIAQAAKKHAEDSGQPLSRITDRALRSYLIAEEMKDQPPTDPEWLEAVAVTLLEMED